MFNRKLALLLIAYAAFIVIGLGSTLLNIAWQGVPGNSMQETFGEPLDSVGVLLFAGTVGGLVMAFVSGRVIGRFGIGAMVVVGSLFGAVGAFGHAVLPLWIPVLLLAFVLSLGTFAIDMGMNNFISVNYSAGRLNWLHACFGIGATIGPTLVTWLVITTGQPWQFSYALIGVLWLVVAGLFALTYKHWTIAPTKTQEVHAVQVAPVRESLRVPVVWVGLTLFFLYGGVEFGTGQMAYTLLTDGRGLTGEVAGLWVSWYWGSFTIGRIVSGVLADRVQLRLLMRTANVAMLVGMALILFNLGEGITLAGLLLLGFSLAPMFPTLIAQTAGRVGLRHAPNAIGFQVGLTGLGIAFVPWFSGVLLERLQMPVEIIPVILMIGAVLVFSLHELLLWNDRRQVKVIPAVQPAGD